ncbi:UDP-glucuronosyltransferase 2C1-like [Branchiostoma lanceolatum]|uniref:UDP-glucuronosyltransferase 2C1-like n=1 Tax=Branchiostoma lanceolatum TaxID=7740 RepID=UPI0034522F4B
MRGKLQCSVILLVVLCLLTSHRNSAENVLMFHMPSFYSHWLIFAEIGQALVDKGHSITVVLPKDLEETRRTERPDFSFESFQDNGTGARINELIEYYLSMAGQASQSVFHTLEAGIDMTGTMTKHCDLLLRDSTLVSRLRAQQYSVAITDPLYPCGALMAAHIDVGLPNIAVMRYDLYFQDVKATGVPLPLSYVASVETDFTDQMTFLQRLQNVGLYSITHVARRWMASSVYDGVAREFLGEGETTLGVMSRTTLWLYQTDLVLDFPRPTMPDMVQVGGLNVREAAPLPEDLEAFMQSSGEDGVAVVSFGTVVQNMSPEQLEVFTTALARLRQKVVWRYVGEKPPGLGNNTKLMKWLPQNDLLGHPKTKVFINHAGYNGVCEALYHGVPMVCLPQFGDHPGNAAQVVARGLGVKLDIGTVTTDQLYQAILRVLYNNSYRETAARLSRLHRDQPQSPMERAVWWIEHVIKHGRLPHLRARAVELPFYQYYLLDVVAFLLAVCTAVLGAVWCSCSFMCRKCCCKSDRKLKSQ